MACFKDLEYCNYFPLQCEALTAIAWLERGSVFEIGPVEETFFRKLCELVSDPWQPLVSPGFHSCELCQFDGPGCSNNVFIPYASQQIFQMKREGQIIG